MGFDLTNRHYLVRIYVPLRHCSWFAVALLSKSINLLEGCNHRNRLRIDTWTRGLMPMKELKTSFAKIDERNWISVHVSQTIQPHRRNCDSQRIVIGTDEPTSCRLFEHTGKARLTLPERFPRLTVAMIAVALLTVSVTAEIEYLTTAGFFWH